MSYGIDRHLSPITLDSTNNGIAFTDPETGNTVATIPESSSAREYYNCAETSMTADGIYGLLSELVSAMNTAVSGGGGTGTYSVSASTPSGSGLTNSGITITRSSGEWSWAFSATANLTLDPRLLGFGAGQSTDVSSTSSAIASPYSIYGVWQTHTLADGPASDKTGDTRADSMQSREDAVLAYTNEKLERDWRHYRYDYVPAMHVTPTTARPGYTTAYWESAGLPAGDYNNGFKDLWVQAKRNATILVVHDEGDQDLQIDSHNWESYRLDPKMRSKFRDVADTQNMNGEYYKVEYDAVIVDGSYDY